MHDIVIRLQKSSGNWLGTSDSYPSTPLLGPNMFTYGRMSIDKTHSGREELDHHGEENTKQTAG